METNRVPPHNYNSLDPSNDALNTIVRASNRLFGRNEDEYLDLDMYPLALDPLHTGQTKQRHLPKHSTRLNHLLTNTPFHCIMLPW